MTATTTIVRRRIGVLSMPLMLAVAGAAPLPQARCPSPPGDILAFASELRVNPDGTPASYTVGDHGFTYVSNGLNLIEGGRTITCSDAANQRLCRQRFAQAEAGAFGRGTPVFCVFAMEVSAPEGGATTPCPGRDRSRRLVGNGLGSLKRGAPLTTVTGDTVIPYPSTTSLQHRVDGRAVHIDSAALPVLVRPRTSGLPLGTIAWLRLGTRSSYAVIGDSGPEAGGYGEGSIALHQLLRYGGLRPQAPGPIAIEDRCGSVERSALPHPYQYRATPGDECRAGRAPADVTDIRARRNLPRVDIVLLKDRRLPMRGDSMIDATLDVASLERAAGPWTPQRLAAVADCLR